MAQETKLDRRQVLVAGVGLLATLPLTAAEGKPAGQLDPDEGVTAPEDLMKEHGVLNRCLLIYEEGMRRIQAKQEVAPEVFLHTAELIRSAAEVPYFDSRSALLRL